jgi:hypothetical protein
MRALNNSGWDMTVIQESVLACLLLTLVTYTLAVLALRIRTSRA